MYYPPSPIPQRPRIANTAMSAYGPYGPIRPNAGNTGFQLPPGAVVSRSAGPRPIPPGGTLPKGSVNTQPTPQGNTVNQTYQQNRAGNESGILPDATSRPYLYGSPAAPGAPRLYSPQMPQLNQGRDAITPGELYNLAALIENSIQEQNLNRQQLGLNALYGGFGQAEGQLGRAYRLYEGDRAGIGDLLQKQAGFVGKNDKLLNQSQSLIDDMAKGQYRRIRENASANAGRAMGDMQSRGMLNSSTRYNTQQNYQRDAERQTQDVDAAQAQRYMDINRQRMGLNDQMVGLHGQAYDRTAQNTDRLASMRDTLARMYQGQGGAVAEYMLQGRQPQNMATLLASAMMGKESQNNLDNQSRDSILGSIFGSLGGAVTGGIGQRLSDFIYGFGR